MVSNTSLMTNNTNQQDHQSFLSVPTDSVEQSFSSSISPQRSESPRSIVSEQLNHPPANSGLGSFRTRARAGTLPSRFSGSLTPALPTAQPLNPSISPSFNAQSIDPNSLNLESLSIANPGSNSGSIRPRLRSGSLLGLSQTNSIWNSDQSQTQPQNTKQQHQQNQQQGSSISSVNFFSTSNSPSNEFSCQKLSISPLKSYFTNFEENPARLDLNRARAYSTNNALINESSTNFYLQSYSSIEEEKFSNQSQPIQQQQDQLNYLNPEITVNRPRAQTFQNGVNNQLPVQFFAQSSIMEPSEYDQSQILNQNYHQQPLLLDDIDPRLLNWTSTFQDPSLGPTSTLFLSNLPPQSVTPISLSNLLIKFGKLSTVRIFRGNESAIVEFDSVDSAMQAKAQLNHQELTPGISCVVAFAKLLPSQRSTTPPFSQQIQQAQPQSVQHESQEQQTPQIHIQSDSQQHTEQISTILHDPPKLADIVNEINDAIKKLGIADDKRASLNHIIRKALDYHGYKDDFGPLPDPVPVREYDAPKLRETRKLIDANSLSQFEIEELSLAMLNELPELASDYLGNTIVQKLFEFSSEPIKYIMLKEVSPYLAQMGIHKNGTWSAQKMISVADTPIQKQLVADSLKPYCTPLFNDQFGNYVIQCSLRFGSPWNDFIFEVILANFWDIAQNRFGARAVRACLESHEATAEQTALISAAIILHAEHLAINQNAALLITWFLDTCTLPNRHILLAPRLVPHLAQLCTHKLASLTVLKILNYRGENEAKNLILETLFGPLNTEVNENGELPKPPEVLEHVLQDNLHGPTFIFKVLSNPLLEGDLRQHVTTQVRRVLLDLNVTSYQGYKRLMDEVGLSNRNDSGRHNRTHSNGTSGSANRKNRQNKSPQLYNKRSTPTGYRMGSNSNLLTTPQGAPPQFMSGQNIYETPVVNNEYMNQYYPTRSQPNGIQQTPLSQPLQQMPQYISGDSNGIYDSASQIFASQQPPGTHMYRDDPFFADSQYSNIQQTQYGYNTAANY